jgi:hypothetical protein
VCFIFLNVSAAKTFKSCLMSVRVHVFDCVCIYYLFVGLINYLFGGLFGSRPSVHTYVCLLSVCLRVCSERGDYCGAVLLRIGRSVGAATGAAAEAGMPACELVGRERGLCLRCACACVLGKCKLVDRERGLCLRYACACVLGKCVSVCVSA